MPASVSTWTMKYLRRSPWQQNVLDGRDLHVLAPLLVGSRNRDGSAARMEAHQCEGPRSPAEGALLGTLASTAIPRAAPPA